jgi:RNA 2',3'-cyclic 3'-phosphodiesterase
MKRIFAAVKIIPEPSLTGLILSMRREMAFHRINWVMPENIHITLKFFGQTHETEIPVISKVLSEAAFTVSSFTLQLSGTGIFGSHYDPKVIWVGITHAGPLTELAMNIQEGFKAIGVIPDRQNFVPHLTLGRIKLIADLKIFQKTMEKYRNVRLQDCVIDRLILYESILRREGPEYHVLETYFLPVSGSAESKPF